ncbi:MAG: DEAD/DEAH box helicase [Clostridia bacterium]|nr:DEAD/DEAH box helicase [Clostridia bacterium]
MEIKKFEEMNINENIKKAIKKMGFEEGTPIQTKAIPYILEGMDVIGIAQTGTGKTSAFGIPAIEAVDITNTSVQTLILCPTRELCIQTCEELKALGLYTKGLLITPIYGGQQIDRQMASLKKKPQIVVGTPGRVMDHLRRKTLKLDTIEMLVLDEADEMLNMGFREDLDVILKGANKERQTVLFSATMSNEIKKITKKYQKEDAVNCTVERKNITAPKIEQTVVRLQESKKLEVLTRIIDSEDTKLAVIFCNTKRKVDDIVEALKTRGYFVDALHGDMKQSQRDVVMRKFRTNKLNILVATDVAARGIDVEDVEIVFNYDIPSDEEYYVHRIGRTGRAGKSGKAITFVTPREVYKLRDIQKYTNVEMEEYQFVSKDIANQKKFGKLFEQVESIINENELDTESNFIESYLEENEISLMDLCAGLIRFNLKDSISDYKDLVLNENDFNSKDRKVKEGQVRLFLTLGKLDKINKNELRDYIVSEAKIDRSDIHGAEVLDKFSFLTVSKEAADEIIEKLNHSTYNGRKIIIEESTKEGKKNGNRSNGTFKRKRN